MCCITDTYPQKKKVAVPRTPCMAHNKADNNSRLLYTKYALIEHIALHSIRRALILMRK